MIEEEWKTIPDFPDYRISNLGRIYNTRRKHIMSLSVNNFGHIKITLKDSYTNERYTRSVAQMVAELFVDPPDHQCTHIILLDGDFLNVAAHNLAWRPQWYAWKYTRQLKTHQPIYYKNLHVRNVDLDVVYRNVVEAGISEGLLFEDIWRSTYTSEKIFPYRHSFKIIERV